MTIDILETFFSNESKRNAFTEALDSCAVGAPSEAIQLFVQSWNDTRFNTYISSLSIHLPGEDIHGRLSMWRGFGGNAPRVGIVLNIPWYSQAAVAMHLLFSPVAYLPEAAAHRVWDEAIEREWRVIYHPKRWPSQLIESSTEVIAGVPQIVYKIPLDATVSESLADLEFSKTFDRLIVEPTIYPWPM